MDVSHYIPQAGAIVTTVVAGLILWRFQRDKLKLNYFLTETDSFDANNSYIKYYTIRLVNSGNKIVEDISVDISFSNGKIDRAIMSDKHNRYLHNSRFTIP